MHRERAVSKKFALQTSSKIFVRGATRCHFPCFSLAALYVSDLSTLKYFELYQNNRFSRFQACGIHTFLLGSFPEQILLVHDMRTEIFDITSTRD